MKTTGTLPERTLDRPWGRPRPSQDRERGRPALGELRSIPRSSDPWDMIQLEQRTFPGFDVEERTLSVEEVFLAHGGALRDKLHNFEKYTSHMQLARFLARHEIFQRVLSVKGSIVECGVHHGGGLMAWTKLSAIFEPYGFNRRVLGFDTFEGFAGVAAEDLAESAAGNDHLHRGGFATEYDTRAELEELLAVHDGGRILNQFRKTELVAGNACETIPEYVCANPHLIVALLFLDFDLYEPTKVALETLLPRMPKGAVVAFDELNHPNWPGETAALLETFDLREHRLEKLHYDPNISFIVL